MDSPIVIPEAQRNRAASVRRRVSLDSNSPEFEFWMVRNPSFPQPNLISADQLFVDGVLLPLHLLPEPDPEPQPEPGPDPQPEPILGPKITSSSTPSSLGQSKRWRDIFKKSDAEKKKEKDKDKEKKRERKSGNGSASTAELNINIWPFSRSRSAGNACTRPKPVFGAPGPARKANSAPCSRSNSAGDSKSRKWPGSPARPGVHLGRSSPVWKVRRNSGGKGIDSNSPLARNSENIGTKRESSEIPHRNKIPTGDGASAGKAKAINLNVPMCMGYRNQLSCRSNEISSSGAGASGGGNNRRGSVAGAGRGRAGVGSAGTGNLFSLRSLFTKKVY